MRDGRWARFALEAGFLVAVAAAAAFARLRPEWIVLAMLVAWVIVALLEWVAWQERPHWGSGLPPRYVVPEQPVPPRPPSVELPLFTAYPRPAPREPEAATWIATPAMRAEVLGWPAPASAAAAEEPQTTVEELPAELLAEAAAAAAGEPEPADDEVGWPVAEPADDPWVDDAAESADEPPPGPAAEAAPPEPEQEPGPRQEPGPAAESAPPASRPARHHLDPFAAADGRRRPWRRAAAADDAVVEIAASPPRAPLAAADGPSPGEER